MTPKVLVLFGATGSGKTLVSIALAKSLNNIEIISADSRQIYKELNIGVAKPTDDQLNTIPHHFISEISVQDHFSVGCFFLAVQNRINKILRHGKIPLIVGGSTLYLDALLRGLSSLPSSPEIRLKLNKTLSRQGLHFLYKELEKSDPSCASKIDKYNSRRIIRALELLAIFKKPIDEILKDHPRQKITSVEFIPVFIRVKRDTLYTQINKRADIMIKQGLLEEASEIYESLIKKEKRFCNPLYTIGYKELFSYFEGKYDLQTAISLIKRNTRNYAKRQLTFFRSKFKSHSICFLGVNLNEAILLIKSIYLT